MSCLHNLLNVKCVLNYRFKKKNYIFVSFWKTMISRYCFSHTRSSSSSSSDPPSCTQSVVSFMLACTHSCCSVGMTDSVRIHRKAFEGKPAEWKQWPQTSHWFHISTVNCSFETYRSSNQTTLFLCCSAYISLVFFSLVSQIYSLFEANDLVVTLKTRVCVYNTKELVLVSAEGALASQIMT